MQQHLALHGVLMMLYLEAQAAWAAVSDEDDDDDWDDVPFVNGPESFVDYGEW